MRRRARSTSRVARPPAAFPVRVVAAAAAGLLSIAAAPAAAATPAAPTTAVTAASARFLAGSLLAGGVDLDRVLALAGVSAADPLGTGARTVASPLGVGSLGTLSTSLPGGVHLPLSQFVRLGAVNQVVRTTAAGGSQAAAGAVADSGALDTGPGAAFPGDATLDLAGLLGPAGRAVLSSAGLTVGGVAAVAAIDGAAVPATSCADLSRPVRCRDYTVARGSLDLAVPAVAALGGTVSGAAGTATRTLDAALSSGLVATTLTTVSGLLGTLNGLLGGLGVVSNTLAVSVRGDLAAALAPLLHTTLSDGVVTLDLATGRVSVDVSALVGGLDGLPPNSAVLDAAALSRVATRVAALLAALGQQVRQAVTRALDAVGITLSGGICLLRALGSCTAGLSVHWSGTLGDVLGAGPSPTVTGTGLLSLTGTALTTVVAALRSALAGAAGPPAGAAGTAVVDSTGRAVAGLTGTLTPALRTLGSVVRLTANVQEPGRTAGSFREVAARVSLAAAGAPAAGVAVVDLARVEVASGPAGRTADPSAPAGRTSSNTGAASTGPASTSGTGRTGGTTTGAAAVGGAPTPGDAQAAGNTSRSAGPGGSGSLPWTAFGALLLLLAAVLAGVVRRVLRRRPRTGTDPAPGV